MTVITITHTGASITLDQRRTLARQLTDAVAVVECGQVTDLARRGFQVHFRALDADAVAIGGTLAHDAPGLDPLVVDIAVMDGHWPVEDRAQVVRNTFAALTDALGLAAVPPGWWVTFRTIDEGSWGANGGPLSMSSLLDTGAFTVDRAAEMRTALEP